MRRFSKIFPVLASSLLALVVASAARADSFFMRLTGGPPGIFGESVGDYDRWIELGSVGWSVTADTSWTQGGGASVGKPAPGDLTWTQSFDSSVPSMLAYISQGKAAATATVEYVKTGVGGPVTYLQLAMTGLFFTGIALDDGGVTGSAVFKTITTTYWPLDHDGNRKAPIFYSWDIPAGTAGNYGTPAGFVAGFGPGGLSQIPPLVPEPGTDSLLLTGLLIIGAAARRRVPV